VPAPLVPVLVVVEEVPVELVKTLLQVIPVVMEE
jgi:hypothetical protein